MTQTEFSKPKRWSAQRKKEAILRLKESEERHRILVDNNMFPVVVTNMKGKALFANKFAYDFFNGSSDKLDEYNVSDFWNNPNDREKFINELKTKGKVDSFEFEIKTRSGKIRTN